MFVPIKNTSVSAVSSMNYLFLRYTANKEEFSESVTHEIQSFLSSINNESFLNKDIRQVIKEEISEGDYFFQMELKDIEALLRNSIHSIVHYPLELDPLENKPMIDLILQEYMALVIETLVQEGDM